MINLPSGQEDFKQLRESGNVLYVDKTYFIKEWWESNDKVTLISRPRYFGKTLNMSMLNYFFSNRYENSGLLFNNLFISNQNEIMAHQGQYPVIFLSFNDVKNGDSEFIKSQIKMKIWQTYLFFKSQLIESDKLDVTEKSFINTITHEMNDYIAIHSIQFLCCFLSKVYDNKGSIILLDQYDSLFVENWNYSGLKNISDEITNFCLNFISSTFKDNNFMMKGIITGVTNFALYANNISVYTLTSPKYANCFGFTKDEVFELTKLFHFESKIDEIESWYGGYSFCNNNSNNIIFNPYSIIRFLNEPNHFSNFWFKSLNHNFLIQIIKDGPLSVKDSMIKLIQEKSIQKELADKLILYNFNDRTDESIWVLLLSIGYLSIEEEEDSQYCSKIMYSLKLPNNEIIESLLILINEMFDGINCYINEFADALLKSNVFRMEQFMNDFMVRCFSFFDPTQTHPEVVYHTFFLGLVAKLKSSFCISLNNQNSNGECFYVAFKPLNGSTKPNMIICLFKKNINEKFRNSLRQIFTKISQHEFTDDFPNFQLENIKKFVFDFDIQKCQITLETLQQQPQQNSNETALNNANNNISNNNNNNNNRNLNIVSNNLNIVRSSSANSYIHHYNIRPRSNKNVSSNIEESKEEIEEKDDKEEESEDDFEDDSDDKNFTLSSSGSYHSRTKKDGFDRRKFHSFHINDEVYVIDPNGVDIWEGIIVHNKPGSLYGIHYPAFPQDDEIIKGAARILRRTPINNSIFRKQEEMRNKSSEENPSRPTRIDDSASKNDDNLEKNNLSTDKSNDMNDSIDDIFD